MLCFGCVFHAVTVGPGDQLVRPERKTHTDQDSEENQVDSTKGSEFCTHDRTHTYWGIYKQSTLVAGARYGPKYLKV